MTADPSGQDDPAVAARLTALDDMPIADHPAVYTAIAVELAARLEDNDEQPGTVGGAGG